MRLRDYIDQHGLKIRRIAEVAGLMPQTVYRVVAGGQVPSAVDALKIVTALATMTGKPVEIADFWAPEPDKVAEE